MSETSQADMERDHRIWQSDHASWIKDISRWQAEHQAAVVRLEELQSFIIEHGGALRAHAQSVIERERALPDLQSQLSQHADTAGHSSDMIAAHRQLAAEHQRQHEAHERIKRHHEAVLARLREIVSVPHRPP